MTQIRLSIPAPAGFRLSTVATSHGWFDLPPFDWSPSDKTLQTTAQWVDRVADLSMSQPSAKAIVVTVIVAGRWSNSLEQAAVATVRRMLGLDQKVEEFFRNAGPEFAWAKKAGAGRLLRSPSGFEDAIKMLATTNCSWSLTRQMATRLVDVLGNPGPSGRKAFPTPRIMASKNDAFFRDEIKTGYRARYFQAFSASVDSGAVDPESWATFDGTTGELIKLIRENRGFGAYAAENLCRLLGRHDGLGLDSWCINKFPKIHGPVEGDVEKAIRQHYAPHGKWQGLALWLDLTRDWHVDKRLVELDPQVAIDGQ